MFENHLFGLSGRGIITYKGVLDMRTLIRVLFRYLDYRRRKADNRHR